MNPKTQETTPADRFYMYVVVHLNFSNDARTNVMLGPPSVQFGSNRSLVTPLES